MVKFYIKRRKKTLLLILVAILLLAASLINSAYLSAQQNVTMDTATAEPLTEKQQRQMDNALAADREADSMDLALLAKRYLGQDSSITIESGRLGVQKFPGKPDRETHCRVFIVLTTEENDGLSTKVDCNIVNPRDAFRADEVHLTIYGESDDYHDRIYDPSTKFAISRDAYTAMVTVLQYYAGSSDHGAYTADPLADATGDFTYTIN